MDSQHLVPGEPIMGERWAIDRNVAHCLFTALDRVRLYLAEDDAQVLYWVDVLAMIRKSGIAITIRPLERDRGFFDALIASERWFLFERHRQNQLLRCGHTADAHQQALGLWAEEFLAVPKRACASSLAALDLMPQEARNETVRCMTRKDAMRLADVKTEEFCVWLREREDRMREQLRREGHPKAAVERIVCHATERCFEDRCAKFRELLLRQWEPYLMDDIPKRGWLG